MNSTDQASDVIVFFVRRNEGGRLPVGTPVLFSRKSGRILEAPTQFLRDCFVRSGKARSRATWRAAAYAIATWWDYLSYRNLDWQDASREDLISFRDFYQSNISPKTGDGYSAGTIAYRMSIVGSFYVHQGEKGSYVGSILSLMTGGPGPMAVESSLEQRKVHRQRLSVQLDTRIVPRSNPTSRIMPYTKSDWLALASTLGPLPSESKNGERARDRLIVEVALTMGLRVGEVASLTIYPFVVITDKHEHVLHHMEVRGKGSRKRMVACPGRLVNEVNLYIENERTHAVNVHQSRDHGTLFVTSTESPRPGSPLSIRRIEEIHAEACVRAGLTHISRRNMSYSGAEVSQSRYRFHDLRHTFAVWLYSVLKSQGDPEPWKVIQAQLGHRSLDTTVNT